MFPDLRLAPLEDEMAIKLNNDDKAWIAEQIKDSHKPRGWKKAGERIRAFGAPSAIVSIFIAMLGITLGAAYQSFSHVREETEFRTKTGDRLDAINKQLSRFNEYVGTVVKKDLRDSADLPQSQFDHELPIVAIRLHSVIQQEVVPDSSTLQMIGEKLNEAPETEAYWPAFGSLASARSFAGKSQDYIQKALSFPDCPMPVGPGFVGANFAFGDCALILDKWSLTNTHVHDLVVKYRGGHLFLKNVRFDNCLFILEIPAQPPLPAKTFVRKLLAQSESNRVLIDDAGA
jgi:hypothetical protein